jgi:hypothetical protein
MRMLIAIAAIFATALAVEARADVFDGLDTSIGTGGIFGTVAETQDDGSLRTFQFGGIPFATMLNRDLAEHWTGSLQFQVLLDVINQQMIRQGVAGTLCYHLLGGARRLMAPGELMSTVSTSTYNLSLAVRGGIFNFAAADRENPADNLSGGIWEMATGVEYRRTLSDTSAAGLSAMQTVITFPASVDRLAAKTTELLAFWRVYL